MNLIEIKRAYDNQGFAVIENVLPEDVYDHILEIFDNEKFEEINQKYDDRYKLWETPEDSKFPSVDEVYQNHFWGSSKVSIHPDVKNVFKTYIRPVMDEMTNGTAGLFRHQATRYHNNGKDFLRIHYDDYMGYAGYILCLQRENWKYDWGGLLSIVIGSEIINFISKRNIMVIIDHSKKMPHWVTPVNYWAKENRNTLTGFCIKKGEDLPKTWTSRSDYAIY